MIDGGAGYADRRRVVPAGDGGGVDDQREHAPTAGYSPGPAVPAVDGALRAWAVAHARTVGHTGDHGGVSPLADGALPAGSAGWWDEPWMPGDVVVEPPVTLTGRTSWVDSVAWATGADGRLLLATGSGDGTVRVWDPVAGQTLHTLTGHTGWVYSVAWATGTDGQLLLATGSGDRT
ncbi:WD40 repeat domain-containing protein, partial [Frankia sp. CIT1]|uniref:WD40 repeat domain-containing protein n=1 Tax=Frankia sp. CIT1 TaxID=2880974 RepID=UPI00351D2149